MSAPALTRLPGVIDRHVHLGLVEHGPLAGGALVEVHDLGWSPAQAAAWRTRPPGPSSSSRLKRPTKLPPDSWSAS